MATKFSEFTTKTDTNDVAYLVGYNGLENVKIDPALLGGSSSVKLTSQTLLESSWSVSGDYYIYTFLNANIDTTCDVSVTPQNSSYLTAYNAQILPFVGVSSGAATFYSQFPPAADMVVDIVITQTT